MSESERDQRPGSRSGEGTSDTARTPVDGAAAGRAGAVGDRRPTPWTGPSGRTIAVIAIVLVVLLVGAIVWGVWVAWSPPMSPIPVESRPSA